MLGLNWGFQRQKRLREIIVKPKMQNFFERRFDSPLVLDSNLSFIACFFVIKLSISWLPFLIWIQIEIILLPFLWILFSCYKAYYTSAVSCLDSGLIFFILAMLSLLFIFFRNLLLLLTYSWGYSLKERRDLKRIGKRSLLYFLYSVFKQSAVDTIRCY